MDVTCPRCQTDYEFDDALVSERGTTVKCTNCGHQFRVFRPRASTAGGSSAATPELWRIERNEGEPLELRSLVELQRAIRAGRVSRADLLRRGDGPARRVGDIPELEPFFPAPRPEGAPNTLPLPSVAEPLPPPPVDIAPSRVPAHTPAYGRAPPGTQIAIGTGTIRPPGGGAVPPPPPRTGSSDRPPPAPRLPTPLGISTFSPSSSGDAGIPQHRPVTPLPPPRTPPPVQHTPNRNDRVSLNDLAMQANVDADPPTMRRGSDSRGMTSKPPVDTSPATGDPYDSLFPPPTQKKRSSVGLIIGVLVVGGAVALGATVFRPQLQRLFAGNPASSGSSTSSKDRDRELAAGDRAKSDGDYAGARDAYMRATAIDDKSLAAWDGLCTAESELASAHWLASLATGSTLERDQAASVGGSAGRSCARWGELARSTEEGAKKVSADLRTIRALAAQGDGSGVRLYLGSHAGDPVIEALSVLADATKKDTATVTAAAKGAAVPMAKAELKNLAAPSDVALAALVAGMSGAHPRLQDAIAELEKRAPRHMLLDTLRGLSSGAPAVAIDAGGVDAAVADSGHADAATKTASTGPVATGGDEPTSPSGDYRDLNKKAYAALAAGDASKAETLFKAALAQHPGDTDALYGLGQIARSRGDHNGAISYFKQALDTSAGFAPARLALADSQWALGQQADAIKNYQAYLDRVSEGSGADRARARIGATKGDSTDTTPTPKPAPKPEPKEDP